MPCPASACESDSDIPFTHHCLSIEINRRTHILRRHHSTEPFSERNKTKSLDPTHSPPATMRVAEMLSDLTTLRPEVCVRHLYSIPSQQHPLLPSRSPWLTTTENRTGPKSSLSTRDHKTRKHTSIIDQRHAQQRSRPQTCPGPPRAALRRETSTRRWHGSRADRSSRSGSASVARFVMGFDESRKASPA